MSESRLDRTSRDVDLFDIGLSTLALQRCAPAYLSYCCWLLQAEALEAERATTVAFLEPLKTQLRDLEDQLKESSMKIDGVKAGISANDKKINSLLKMMVTS